jgi:hypothetical protein
VNWAYMGLIHEKNQRWKISCYYPIEALNESEFDSTY